MSRSHFPALDAIVFQLVAELESYDGHIQQLAQDWQAQRDVVLFGETGRSMDRMRTLAVSLPQLSAHWVMVMISHTELMHNFWRVSRGEALDMAIEVEDHLACVRAMATHCRRMLTQGGRALH